MDGRDIGTVVLPNADCKVFLEASVEERARRRGEEHGASAAELAATRDAILARDRRDREREHSPLRAAPDAWVVDTTPLTAEEVLTRLLERVHALARP
jgi:cytidylate kinase